MTTETLFTLLFQGGIGGIIIAAMVGFFSRRARKIDPSKTLAEASGITLDSLAKDYARVKGENLELRAQMAKEAGQQRSVLREHATWDRLVVARLRAAGIDIPDPPLLHFEDIT